MTVDRGCVRAASRLFAAIALALLVVGSATTSVEAEVCTCDAPDATRVDVREPGSTETRPVQVSDIRERFASTSVGVRGTSTTPNSARNATKPGPKPWPEGPHNQTIQRRIGELESDGMTHLNGGSLREEVVQIPAGGCRTCRRPDITMQRPDGSIYRENVGRTLGDGSPVPREVSALDDLALATGSRPGFTAYDR